MLSVVSQTLVIVSSSVIPEQRTLIFGGSVSTLSHCTSSIISSYFRSFLWQNYSNNLLWKSGKCTHRVLQLKWDNTALQYLSTWSVTGLMVAVTLRDFSFNITSCHVLSLLSQPLTGSCVWVEQTACQLYAHTLHPQLHGYNRVDRLSLVPRPPHPAFVACSTKSGGRPGQTYHMMRAAADVMFSLLTSGFVLSPSLFFP